MKQECQYLFKKKKRKEVLKKILKTDVNEEIIMAYNTQLILQNIASQRVLGRKLLGLTNKEIF